jgi:hypothetical protein
LVVAGLVDVRAQQVLSLKLLVVGAAGMLVFLFKHLLLARLLLLLLGQAGQMQY